MKFIYMLVCVLFYCSSAHSVDQWRAFNALFRVEDQFGSTADTAAAIYFNKFMNYANSSFNICVNPIESSWISPTCPTYYKESLPRAADRRTYTIFDGKNRYFTGFDVTPECISGFNLAEGTCNTPTCPEPDLVALMDPDAIRFEAGDKIRPDKLTAPYQAKLACVSNLISNMGGTSTLTSAWRPSEYQRHLKEIINKDGILTPIFIQNFKACIPLRKIITAEMSKHGLRSGQPVAAPGYSRHETGRAFDLTPSSELNDTQLQSILKSCGVTNNSVKSEPWHMQ